MNRLNQYIVTRQFKIDAGHRINKHESKCKYLHGHEYWFEVTATRIDDKDLDDLGRVIDFGVLKERIEPWLMMQWDHGLILEREDPLTDVMISEEQKVYILEHPPTAENLAAELLEVANYILDGTGVKVAKVKCRETSNCWAEVTAG